MTAIFFYAGGVFSIVHDKEIGDNVLYNKPGVGEFCWNRLMTPDVEKAKKFYTDLFGWDTFEIDVEDSKYTIFQLEGNNIGGLVQQTSRWHTSTYRAHWMSYIAVNNIHVAVEKAVALGATVELVPTLLGNIGKVAVIVDPVDAYVGLWQSISDMY